MKHTDLEFPELLAPAGDMDRLETALLYGADAVYLGGTELNLRGKSRGFSWEELGRGLARVHARNRKVYFCLNVLPWNRQLEAVKATLDLLSGYPLDGLIVADPGVVALARKRLPGVPLHLSTQANTGNAAAVCFWRDQGLSRINLARELRAQEIRSITEAAAGIELEVFVHGAQCMAVSGRCHLSAYLNQRSANQGLCTHPCRFDYRPLSLTLEEKTRQGPVWELGEESAGLSPILAAEDLCLVKYLAWFVRLGITALKIEGRMKTSSYLAVVTDVYATALNDLQEGGFRPGLYLAELGLAATRPLETGFFLPGKRRRLFSPGENRPACPVLGQVQEQHGESGWVVRVKHRWSEADALQILAPGLQRPQVQPGTYGLEKENGRRVSEIHSGQTIILRCEHPRLAQGFMLRRAAAVS
ncbi:MAG: U32 family peptidase [Desulfohalobiaceae bacterium]|nr:U32 family peptidase [Desulfohalobiaceae bacterium]